MNYVHIFTSTCICIYLRGLRCTAPLFVLDECNEFLLRIIARNLLFCGFHANYKKKMNPIVY